MREGYRLRLYTVGSNTHTLACADVGTMSPGTRAANSVERYRLGRCNSIVHAQDGLLNVLFMIVEVQYQTGIFNYGTSLMNSNLFNEQQPV